jgi:integrase
VKLIAASEVTKQKGLEYLKVDPKTKKIWVDRYKKGRNPERLSRSTGFILPQWDRAKEKRDQLFQEWLGLSPKKLVVKLNEEIWPDFLEIQKKYRLATQEAAKYAGKRFIPFFGDKYPTEIDEVTFDQYVIWRRGKTHPKISFRNDIKWLKRYVKYLQTKGFYVDHSGVQKPLPKFIDPNPKKRKGKGIGKSLTADQIQALLNKAPIADRAGDLVLQILMGFTMFMRQSEIMFLDWPRVDLKRKVLILDEDHTKTKQYREVNISPQVFEILVKRKLEAKSQLVFPSPVDPAKSQGRQGNKTVWTECRRLAKVKCRFHDLRHSGLTRAFQVSNQWAQICLMAGLSLEEAERTYLHITSKDTEFVADLVST